MSKYKKYILFQCDTYYPNGGLSDITGSFDTMEEAVEYAEKNPYECNGIVDRDTWEEYDWNEAVDRCRPNNP